MGNRVRCILLYLWVFLEFSFIIVIHGGIDEVIEGFISIDCGQEWNYTDVATGLPYVSDSDFVDTGESHKIPNDMKQYALNSQGYHLRNFPNGTRNCYRLSIEKNRKYLIRASFMYANYDKINRVPQFDLYLGVNLWSWVDLEEPTSHKFLEIIALASRNWMFVCLVNTGSGIPFISSLELRRLDDDMYPLVMSNQSSVLFERYNFQPFPSDELRYPKDSYDRIWMAYQYELLNRLWTASNIVPCANCFEYPAPMDVLKTCMEPNTNGSTLNFTFQWSLLNNIISPKIAFILHYAETQSLTTDQSRSYLLFSNFWNGSLGPYSYPSYLKSNYFSSREPMTLFDDLIYFALSQADSSTFPPILSAIEIYEVKDLTEFISTKEEEVESMMEIKEYYKLQKNWQGDPCAPKHLVWKGVECSSNAYHSWITSLNLASFGLYGTISTSLMNLQQLKYLNLSNNHLHGTIPNFLVDMPNLHVLDLSRNNLNGLIPTALEEKSNLILSVEGNPNLCYKHDECERPPPRKTVIIILTIVASVTVLLLILFVVWKVKTKE